MVASFLKIGTPKNPQGVWMRSISSDDLAALAIWKNTHRESFFFQQELTQSDQENWFQAYLKRPMDYMFIVMQHEYPVGCVGLRKYGGECWDIYNIIVEPWNIRGSCMVMHW